MRKPIFVLAGLALLASGTLAGAATVNSADHKDSPSVSNDLAADNTDIYAFRNGDNLVVAAGFFPLTSPSDTATIQPDTAVTFQLEVDRTGDVMPDTTVNFRFTSNPSTLVIEGLSAQPISAPITPGAQQDPIITTSGPVKVFAGMRDDPFFFDLTGFQSFVANPQKPVSGLRASGQASDTFAGTNVFAIVVELPITAVTGANAANTGTIKVVGNINRGGNAVDRVAIPAVNTALVPAAQKNDFNQNRNELDDVARFKPGVVSTIDTLRKAVDPILGGTQDGGPLGNLTSDQVASALLPYVVTIDFSKPVQFPNGRRLQDDVIDAALGLTLNRGGAAGVSDGVNANDKPLLTSFPYLAAPHMAADGAAGAGAMRPPSTGDGGLLDDSGSMWMLSGVLLVLSLGLGGAGAFAAMRVRNNR